MTSTTSLTTEVILGRANRLASHCAGAGVPDEQLSLALVHLKRHRDVGATLDLLRSLLTSPFARRTGRTPDQFKALEQGLRTTLSTGMDWRDAAAVVGWARRLVGFYSKER